MNAIEPTTHLSIVNEMLIAIGEAPVNQISEGYSDARNAERILNVTSKAVQAVGWWFNTEANYPLRPNAEGEIKLPNTLLKADFNNQRYVKRGLRVYDKVSFSYQIGHEIKADIVKQLPIDEVPEIALTFIKHKAIKRFQEDTLGSPSLSNQDSRDAEEAYEALIAADAENQNCNLIDRMRANDAYQFSRNGLFRLC